MLALLVLGLGVVGPKVPGRLVHRRPVYSNGSCEAWFADERWRISALPKNVGGALCEWATLVPCDGMVGDLGLDFGRTSPRVEQAPTPIDHGDRGGGGGDFEQRLRATADQAEVFGHRHRTFRLVKWQSCGRFHNSHWSVGSAP
jgi:hypothetical protein